VIESAENRPGEPTGPPIGVATANDDNNVAK